MEKTLVEGGRPPKFYRIERDRDTGTVSVSVGVSGPEGICWRALAHCNLHSPTGFEIGYGRSGPADTAASILADYFGEDRNHVEDAWRGRAARPSAAAKLHQRFKAEVIASIDVEAGKSYLLDESRITAWLVDRHPEYVNPLQSVRCAGCGETLWREPDVYGSSEVWQEAVRCFRLEHRHQSAEEDAPPGKE